MKKKDIYTGKLNFYLNDLDEYVKLLMKTHPERKKTP
jgi:hypothetical protein